MLDVVAVTVVDVEEVFVELRVRDEEDRDDVVVEAAVLVTPTGISVVVVVKDDDVVEDISLSGQTFQPRLTAKLSDVQKIGVVGLTESGPELP